MGIVVGRAGSLVSLLLATVVVSYIWVPYDPRRVGERWLGMSVDHWFGTDAAGKDLFSQVLVGAVSLFVAVASALIAGVIGIALGVLSAITPRLVGEPVAYFIDVLIALPTLVLALVLVGLFKGSLVTVSLAIGVSSGVVLARILRAEAAGAGAGLHPRRSRAPNSTWRTVRRHVIPNIAPIAIVQVSLIAALAILAEAALSFLGVMSRPDRRGARPSASCSHTSRSILAPSCSRARRRDARVQPLGDGLRDATDPRLRSGRRGIEAPPTGAGADPAYRGGQPVAAAPITHREP